MLLILSLDPGETTGICLLDTPMSVCYSGQIQDEDTLFQFLEDQDYDEVVIEGFRLSPLKVKHMSHSDLVTVQLIGKVKHWCRRNDVLVSEQSPSQKRFFTNDVLRTVGVYQPGMPHANDAVRHALHRSWVYYQHMQDKRVQKILKRVARKEVG